MSTTIKMPVSAFNVRESMRIRNIAPASPEYADRYAKLAAIEMVVVVEYFEDEDGPAWDFMVEWDGRRVTLNRDEEAAARALAPNECETEDDYGEESGGEEADYPFGYDC